VAERDDDGTPKRLQSWCSCCQRVHQRIVKGEEVRGRPYEAHRPNKLGIPTDAQGYAPQNEREREIYRAHQRERYANRTPEQIEDQREYHRIYAEAKRRQAGIAPRPFKRLAPQRPVGRFVVMLDAEPFLLWLTRWLEAMDFGLEQLARESGVASRRILDARASGKVGLDTVDRMMTTAGEEHLVYVLYPLDE
jgi:hypothetical protein